MGGYHQLPVTPYNPQPQENPVDQYARLQQLAGMQQQRQIQSNQIQAGQQENEMRALQLKDQQTLRSTFTDPNIDFTKPDAMDKVIQSAAQKGVSPQTLMQLRNSQVEYQKNLATLNETQLKNQVTQADQRRGTLMSIVQTKDPQQKQSMWDQELTKEEQAGTIQPNQISHQYPGDDAATVFANHMALGSTLAKEQTERMQAEARKASAETSANRLQNELPGGALRSPEQKEMDDFVAHPPKGYQGTPQDFAKWKATLAPAAQINVAAGAGGGLSDTARDQAAEKYWQTGQLPPGSRGAAGMVQNRAIMNRAAELHPEGSLAENSAEFKANEQSLKHLQTNFDQVTAFENTALKNLDQVAQAGAKIPDLSARFANVPVRAISANMIGTPEMARFKTALLTAQTEAAKVLSSANANGVLSDSARHEAQDILDGNLPFPAMMSSINQLKADFGNRHQSYADQIADIKGRMGGKAPEAKGGPITVTDPRGHSHTFPDQKSADAFKKAANIQ